MKAALSWIREYVDLPPEATLADLTWRLTMLGLKLEGVEGAGTVTGPLVVGRVLTLDEEPQKNGKVIRWCTVDVGAANGTGEPQGVVCGAHNFGVGDLVVVCLPGAVLPGGFVISARKTYGHVSAGMICSERELGLGEDHDGIIVLNTDAGAPGDDAIVLLGLDDPVIEFEINPDRAYAMSVRGIAREAALAYGVPYADPADRRTPEANESGYPVRVEAPDLCPLFVTRTVSGVDPAAPTPGWLARRVRQCGMRSISLGVDVTNYVMLEMGNPIHGYDGDRLSGPIVVRRALPGERLTTLDGVTRDLAADDLLITDDSGPIGLAGVMGGESTELQPTTSTVVIEAAHFTPVGIFHTARRHRLSTDGAKRWERGVDPRLPEAAADRVAELLVRYGGGTLEPGVTVVGRPPERTRVSIPLDLPTRVSGVDIAPETVVADLEAVGCGVRVAEGTLVADVPSWRPDLTDPSDLVEEVVRVVGYDRVPSVLPPAPPGRGLTTEQRLRRRVGLSLAGAGFTEVISYPFVGDADWSRLGLPDEDPRRQTLRMANPLRAEEPQLTTTLLPGVLRALARNVGRGNPDLALFEHSLVFLPTGNEVAPILAVDRAPTADEWATLLKAVPHQPLHLAVALTGRRDRDGWWGRGRSGSWADAIGAVRDVAAALGVELEVTTGSAAPWHPGRCAELRVRASVLGHAGELHPRVCAAYDLPARSAAAEVDLETMLQHAVAVAPGPRFSSFPVAKEDVALLVDASVPAAAVEAALREGAGDLLETVRLFDVYTGAPVPAGQKSLAFALRFRAPDRTLTEADAAAARDSAVALAATRLGARQR